MTALWESSLGRRRSPPGLPRPVAFLPAAGVVLSEWLDGQPLLELGPAGATGVGTAVGLLADLHGCDAVPARRRTAGKIVRSVRRKASEAGARAPALAGLFDEVAHGLERTRPPDGELVPA